MPIVVIFGIILLVFILIARGTVKFFDRRAKIAGTLAVVGLLFGLFTEYGMIPCALIGGAIGLIIASIGNKGQ